MTEKNSAPRAASSRLPAELFYRHGIRAVGVEAIAEAAGTNKMTLYRHFASKDELVAEYLRSRRATGRAAGRASTARIPATHWRNCGPGSRTWPTTSSTRYTRLCARQCGGRAAGEGSSGAPRHRGVQAARARGWSRSVGRPVWREPELLADELNLMLEGARVSAQSVGTGGPARPG